MMTDVGESRGREGRRVRFAASGVAGKRRQRRLFPAGLFCGKARCCSRGRPALRFGTGGVDSQTPDVVVHHARRKVQ